MIAAELPVEFQSHSRNWFRYKSPKTPLLVGMKSDLHQRRNGGRLLSPPSDSSRSRLAVQRHSWCSPEREALTLPLSSAWLDFDSGDSRFNTIASAYNIRLLASGRSRPMACGPTSTGSGRPAMTAFAKTAETCGLYQPGWI